MSLKFLDVINYEGGNDVLVWKHPCEDFNTASQLIVHESQEAIFFMNGQALDLFGPGRYTLETQNIPLISKALNRVTGDKSPFHCEVYFINKTEKMSMKWGSDICVRVLFNQRLFARIIRVPHFRILYCFDMVVHTKMRFRHNIHTFRISRKVF